MMALLFLFSLFALFTHVHLYTPEEERLFHEKTCPSFRCLGGGETMFPYRNATAPDFCGPFTVQGCDGNVQTIQLEKGGRRYEVKSISQGNTISVSDNDLKRNLENRSCQSFNSLSFPNLTYAAFHIISKNQTMFKCRKSNHPDKLHNLLNHTGCESFNIYYAKRDSSLPTPPPNCSILHLPGKDVYDKRSYGDIFGLLTANFTLDVGFLPTCYWCNLSGRTCSPTRDGKLECIGVEVSKKVAGKGMLGWKLGIGGLGFAFFAAVTILLLFYLHKRKHNLVSANTSSDTFSKSDMEESGNCFGVPIFSNSELEKATTNFHPENEIGDGGFGTVYYGKLQDGQEVAIKRLYEHNFKRITQFMNEIKILTNLSHKNLVTLYGCSSHLSRELLLVYEYVPNGTVAEHLHGKLAMTNPLAWPIRMKIAIETASALAYLHSSEIIHRDVKTNNILLDNRFCVKVADFGLSRLFPTDMTHVSTAPQGTPGYLDPEYYHCYQLTDRSDVYSFGVVLVELISSMPAVDVTRHRHQINLSSFAIDRIQKGALDELIDPCLGYNSDEEVKRTITSVAELAFLCLQQDKEMRPSMNEVLEGLKGIEKGGNNESETDKNEAAERIDSASPAPDCSIAPLLKNLQPSCSPVSVTHKWITSRSSSSTLLKLSSREDFFDTDLVFKDSDETTG